MAKLGLPVLNLKATRTGRDLRLGTGRLPLAGSDLPQVGGSGSGCCRSDSDAAAHWQPEHCEVAGLLPPASRSARHGPSLEAAEPEPP
jgi:hypothetical protein